MPSPLYAGQFYPPPPACTSRHGSPAPRGTDGHCGGVETLGKRGNLAPRGYDDAQPADELAHSALDWFPRFPHRRQFPATNWRAIAGQLVSRATRCWSYSPTHDPPTSSLSSVVAVCPANVSLGQSRGGAESEPMVLGRSVVSTGGFDLGMAVPGYHLARGGWRRSPGAIWSG